MSFSKWFQAMIVLGKNDCIVQCGTIACIIVLDVVFHRVSGGIASTSPSTTLYVEVRQSFTSLLESWKVMLVEETFYCFKKPGVLDQYSLAMNSSAFHR